MTFLWDLMRVSGGSSAWGYRCRHRVHVCAWEAQRCPLTQCYTLLPRYGWLSMRTKPVFWDEPQVLSNGPGTAGLNVQWTEACWRGWDPAWAVGSVPCSAGKLGTERKRNTNQTRGPGEEPLLPGAQDFCRTVGGQETVSKATQTE
jgi:hypothetical protein